MQLIIVRYITMIFLKLRIFMGIGILLFGNASRADKDKQLPRWEFWTGSIADFSKVLDSKTFSGNFLGGKSAVLPSVGYFVSERIEALFAPSFSFHSSGNYLGRVVAGAAIHFFGSTAGDSAFGKVLIGFDDLLDNRTSDSVQFSLSTFVWSLSIGKRFQITPSFSYSPELNFTTLYDDYSPMSTLTLVPLQFSLFL